MYTDFGVSIPAVRVRYIKDLMIRGSDFYGFNSRSAGKIHMPELVPTHRNFPRFQFPQCG